jgi:hypothetical protein
VFSKRDRNWFLREQFYFLKCVHFYLKVLIKCRMCATSRWLSSRTEIFVVMSGWQTKTCHWVRQKSKQSKYLCLWRWRVAWIIQNLKMMKVPLAIAKEIVFALCPKRLCKFHSFCFLTYVKMWECLVISPRIALRFLCCDKKNIKILGKRIYRHRLNFMIVLPCYFNLFTLC